MKKQNQTYNDGILEIQEKHVIRDAFNTPTSQTTTTTRRFWFRRLGITSEEQYFAMQVDTAIISRVAIPTTLNIDSNMKVKIKDKIFGIARVYHNEFRKETELSLYEVNKHERKR